MTYDLSEYISRTFSPFLIHINLNNIRNFTLHFLSNMAPYPFYPNLALV